MRVRWINLVIEVNFLVMCSELDLTGYNVSWITKDLKCLVNHPTNATVNRPPVIFQIRVAIYYIWSSKCDLCPFLTVSIL